MRTLPAVWLQILKRTDVILFGVCLAVFALFPQIDLLVTSQIYDAGRGFYLADNVLVRGSYYIFARIQYVVIALLLLHWVYTRFFMSGEKSKHSYRSAYLLLLLIVGPGLVVNSGLKEEWGRARPKQISEFGGTKQFTPALQPANQCQSNCSFVSGHAAMGFYLMGMAWITQRRRWLLAGIALGALVGGGRILQGGHFFGDVVFSFWAVYFSAALIAYFGPRPLSLTAVRVQPLPRVQ